VETEAEKVAKIFHDLKTDISARTADLEKKIEVTRTAMHDLQQAQIAAHRAAEEAKLGTRSDLDGVYVHRAVDIKDAAQYLTVKDGPAVQLGGHFVTEIDRGQVVRSWRPGLLDDAPRCREQLDLQRAVTRRNFARMHLPVGRKFTPRLDAEVREAAKACGPVVAKIFADSSGIGAEWVPDTFLPELERDVLVPSNFAAIFNRRNLPPGGVKIPQRSGRLRVYRHAAPSADNPASVTLATLTTANSQIDPASAYVATQIDREFEEDSIIAILPELSAEMVRAIQFAEDDTIINGDTNATHQDTISAWDNRGELGGTSGLGTTADHRRRWLGLRPRAYDLTSMTTDQSATQTFAGLRTALGKLSARSMMGGYMAGSNIIVAPSWEYFFTKMLDATAFSEFSTFEKVGALASVLTGKVGQGGLLPGQVGFLQGFIPVVIPWALSADLETSGLYTNGSGAKTGMLQFDRTRFEYCVRQGAMLESATDITNNTQTLVMRFRTLFRALDAVGSTVKDVHFSYNLSAS
jgi:hypothetical protein